MRLTGNSLRAATLALLLAAGVLAGAQLGKIAPLVGWYQDEIGFSLTLIGWLTAMIGIFVALASLPAGWAIDRIGTRTSFFVGAVVLAAGGFGVAALRMPEAILAARLVEGLGYLILVIAIPALLSSVSPPQWRAPALAIWGGFVAVGYALANFLADTVLPQAEPQAFLLLSAVLFAVLAACAAVLLLLTPDWAEPRAEASAPTASLKETMTAPVLLIAATFGIYVVLSIGFFAFMPAFVAGEGAHLLLSAGAIALIVPLGNLLAGILMRGGDARFAALLAFLGFVLTAVAAVPAFGPTSPVVATVGAVLLAISGGVVASALFAAIPLVTPRSGSVAVAIGLVAQTGGIGTLFGPPLAGHIIERYGWTGFAWFLVFSALCGALCLVSLIRRRRAAPHLD